MADKIIWLDFNDAPDQSEEPVSDTDALREGLLARIESVLFTLLPEGKIRHGKFRVGDVLGSPGRSLEVELNSGKAGLWIDRATGQGGDIFDLIAAHRGIDTHSDFPKVLELAAELLGHAPAEAPVQGKKKPAPLDDLGPHTAKWDYWSADGKLLACVYRYDPPSGKQYRPCDVLRGVRGAPKVRLLYNLPGIATADTVVLVEGEKCAQALIDLGICATTTMSGANAPVKKTDWSPLAGKVVTIWPDKDKPGWDYAMHVGAAAIAAGAVSCAVLLPPDDKPKAWDAADAIAEGFDVQGFIASGERITIQPPSTDVAEPTERAVWATEDALALDFTRRYADDWRYVAPWGKWLVWTGQRWQAEHTLCAQHLMRHVCRDASLKVDSPRLATRLAASGTVSGVERLARTDRRHAAAADEWDPDPGLLNTPGGVVDLQTGRIRPHARKDRMTRITTATPKGDCPVWRTCLATVTGGDEALQAYLARVAGYTLTGVTSEHALFFLYGTGANGKSVFVNTLAAILGDYATNAPMDTFMETRSDRHPTDLAGLRGARFVSSIETEQGRRWAESKIKALTGGDKIAARFMRQDFFEFIPQFKLIIAGNHKPAIRSIDEALKRRLHLVPFTVTIPPEKRDQQLPQKLLAERDGILAWMLAGCLEWRRDGLRPPTCVLAATEEYFEAEDAIGCWVDERCFVDPNAKALVADLYADWKEWAEKAGEYVGSIKRFSEQLRSRKFTPKRNGVGGRGFEGLSLRPTTDYSYPYKDD